LSSADIFRTRGVLQMRTSTLLGAKNVGFLKFIVCLHGKGELNQCGHVANKWGGGSIFFDFVRTSFMDGSLAKISMLF